MALLTPRTPARGEPHVVKVDQIPRWDEHDPAFEPGPTALSNIRSLHPNSALESTLRTGNGDAWQAPTLSGAPPAYSDAVQYSDPVYSDPVYSDAGASAVTPGRHELQANPVLEGSHEPPAVRPLASLADAAAPASGLPLRDSFSPLSHTHPHSPSPSLSLPTTSGAHQPRTHPEDPHRGAQYSDNLYSDTDIRRTYSAFVDPLTEKQRGRGRPRAQPGFPGFSPHGAGGGRGLAQPSPFPVAPAVNSRVLLWRGEPWKLEVDVVVNSTNEALEEAASSPGLHVEAGPGLAEECAALGGCRTGEVKVSGPHELAARHIFHTVGPRYSAKYHTAAENALSSCYRCCLEALVELDLRSIAIPCLYSEAKGYPRELAAHVAIRTVRRFLEKHAQMVAAVVFCLLTQQDNDIYKRLLPLYFPRDAAEEEAAGELLPEDTGDETGGALAVHRRIRIGGAPPGKHPGGAPLTPRSTSSLPLNAPHWSEALEALVAREFLEVAQDPDLRRKEQWGKTAAAQAHGLDWVHALGLEGLAGPRLTLGEEFVVHQRYLSHAAKLDFTQLHEMKILVRGGADFAGRQVVAVVGAHFLPRSLDLDSFVLYLVKELDAVMHRPFCLVYYHTAVHLPPVPNFAWVARLHHVLGPRHRRNLQAIYVVHPTVGLRAAIWALQTFIDPVVWSKVVYISRLADLFRYVPRDQATLPEFVIMHDIEANPMDALTLSYQVHAGPSRPMLTSRDF